jgi:hypothetical protein
MSGQRKATGTPEPREAPLLLPAFAEVNHYLIDPYLIDNVSNTSPSGGRPKMCRRCHSA